LVLAFNGERVVVREDDPVDLNGNGAADDGYFIHNFKEDGCFLTADGSFYFIANLRDGDDVPRGQAFLMIDLNGGAPVVCNEVDFNNDGVSFDPTDIDAFLSVSSEGPCIPIGATCDSIDFNNDGSLFDPCDIAPLVLVFSEGPCTLCGF
jgi:hypothetical protein